MKNAIFFLVFMIIGIYACNEDFDSGNLDNNLNQNDLDDDMLTPEYYLSSKGETFKDEVDKFIGYVKKDTFWHPLRDVRGLVSEFIVPTNGEFGAGKGFDGTSQYHPAVDLHVDDNETNVNIYAAHNGYVSTVRDAPKYRQYVSITKDIKNDNDQIIGKLVSIYAHVDLDLDEAGSLFMDDKYVNKGDTISKHLYSGTVGGPHLHFEIRYYRASDIGNEEYYGSRSLDLTEPSAGIWSYGYWNPKVAYGYGNPINYGLSFY